MKRRILKSVGFAAMGLLAAVVVLAGMELTLRVLNVGADRQRRDPFAGFSHTVPLFESWFFASSVYPETSTPLVV